MYFSFFLSLFVVVPLLPHVVWCFGGICQCAFLFCVGFFLWSYVDVLVICRRIGTWCILDDWIVCEAEPSMLIDWIAESVVR
jgi:hypothetical protein